MNCLSRGGLLRALGLTASFAVLVAVGACDSSSSKSSACEPGIEMCECTKKSDCELTEDCVNNQCVPTGLATSTVSSTSGTTTNSSTGAGGNQSSSANSNGAGGAAGESSSEGSGSGGTGASASSTGGTSNSGLEAAVVLLLDRSTSADVEFDDGDSRWEAVVAALTEKDGPVEQHAPSLALGVLDYTGFQGGTCPELGDGVAPEPDNYEEVRDYIADLELPEEKSETPTREAIERATEMLTGRGEPKAIVLITDGTTDDTCGQFDNHACVSQAYYAAQQAFGADVRTYILGITDLEDDYLQGVANAGVGEPVATSSEGSSCGPENEQPQTSENGGHAPFWQAQNTDEIRQHLESIFQTLVDG